MNNKIFVIGSNKTGTTSLTKSLSTLGFNVCPEYCYQRDSKILKNFQDGLYEELFDLVDKFDAFEDRPWNHTDFYKILDNKFSNSKFILTIRDTDSWINSVKRWGNRIGEINPEFYKIVSQTCYGVDSYLSEESVVIAKYNERNFEIINYFKNRGNLLIIDVEKGDGWQKICQFLECEVPNVPFPYLNKNLYGKSKRSSLWIFRKSP
jgi:hypothetical protein